METFQMKILSLYVIGIGVRMVHSCDIDGIADCGSAYNSAVIGRTFASEQEVTTVCNTNLQTYKTCLRGKTVGCATSVTSSIQGEIDSLEYAMCGDGRQGTVQYSSCFSNDAIGELACVHTFRLVESSLLGSQKEEQLCTHVYNFLDCLRSEAIADCGAGITTWYDNYAASLRAGFVTGYGCGCSAVAVSLTLLFAAGLLQWLIR